MAQRHHQREQTRASLEAGLRRNPNSADLHDIYANFLVREYGDKERHNAAMAHFEVAIKLNDRLIESMNRLALLKAGRGDKKGAQELYEQCLKVNPRYCRARRNLGLMFRREGRRDEAIVMLKSAVDNDPADSGTWFSLGVESRDYLKDNQKAIEYFTECIRVDPLNTSALEAIAQQYRILGNPMMAEIFLLRVTKIAPMAFEYRALLAEVYLKDMSLPSVAIKVYLEALEREPLNPKTAGETIAEAKALITAKGTDQDRKKMNDILELRGSSSGSDTLSAWKLWNRGFENHILEDAIAGTVERSDTRCTLGHRMLFMRRGKPYFGRATWSCNACAMAIAAEDSMKRGVLHCPVPCECDFCPSCIAAWTTRFVAPAPPSVMPDPKTLLHAFLVRRCSTETGNVPYNRGFNELHIRRVVRRLLKELVGIDAKEFGKAPLSLNSVVLDAKDPHAVLLGQSTDMTFTVTRDASTFPSGPDSSAYFGLPEDTARDQEPSTAPNVVARRVLWGVGCIWGALLTGAYPHEDDSPEAFDDDSCGDNGPLALLGALASASATLSAAIRGTTRAVPFNLEQLMFLTPACRRTLEACFRPPSDELATVRALLASPYFHDENLSTGSDDELESEEDTATRVSINTPSARTNTGLSIPQAFLSLRIFESLTDFAHLQQIVGAAWATVGNSANSLLDTITVTRPYPEAITPENPDDCKTGLSRLVTMRIGMSQAECFREAARCRSALSSDATTNRSFHVGGDNAGSRQHTTDDLRGENSSGMGQSEETWTVGTAGNDFGTMFDKGGVTKEPDTFEVYPQNILAMLQVLAAVEQNALPPPPDAPPHSRRLLCEKVTWVTRRQFRVKLRFPSKKATKSAPASSGEPEVTIEGTPARLDSFRMPVHETVLIHVARGIAESLQVFHAAKLVCGHVSLATTFTASPEASLAADTGYQADIRHPLQFSLPPVAGLTQRGMPALLAMELRAGRPAEAATDIYFLGITLLEAAFGCVPTTTTGAPTVPMGVLSYHAAAFISSCIAPDPRDRPSATDLLRHSWFKSLDRPTTLPESTDAFVTRQKGSDRPESLMLLDASDFSNSPIATPLSGHNRDRLREALFGYLAVLEQQTKGADGAEPASPGISDAKEKIDRLLREFTDSAGSFTTETTAVDAARASREDGLIPWLLRGDATQKVVAHVEGYSDILFYAAIFGSLGLYRAGFRDTESDPEEIRFFAPTVGTSNNAGIELRFTRNSSDHNANQLCHTLGAYSTFTVTDKRFLYIRDNDLKAVSSDKANGMVEQQLTFNKYSPWSYHHRLRWGRAIENYILAGTAPLALAAKDPVFAFGFVIEAFATISKHFFPLPESKMLDIIRCTAIVPEGYHDWAPGAGTGQSELSKRSVEFATRVLKSIVCTKRGLELVQGFLALMKAEAGGDPNAPFTGADEPGVDAAIASLEQCLAAMPSDETLDIRNFGKEAVAASIPFPHLLGFATAALRDGLAPPEKNSGKRASATPRNYPSCVAEAALQLLLRAQRAFWHALVGGPVGLAAAAGDSATAVTDIPGCLTGMRPPTADANAEDHPRACPGLLLLVPAFFTPRDLVSMDPAVRHAAIQKFKCAACGRPAQDHCDEFVKSVAACMNTQPEAPPASAEETSAPEANDDPAVAAVVPESDKFASTLAVVGSYAFDSHPFMDVLHGEEYLTRSLNGCCESFAKQLVRQEMITAAHMTHLLAPVEDEMTPVAEGCAPCHAIRRDVPGVFTSGPSTSAMLSTVLKQLAKMRAIELRQIGSHVVGAFGLRMPPGPSIAAVDKGKGAKKKKPPTADSNAA